MLFNFEDFIKNSSLHIGNEKEIVGIDQFLNSLEFHFFSNVVLKNNKTTNDTIHLVLELNCRVDLLELLSHFNTGRWGNNGKVETPLKQCLEILNSKNNIDIDIEEITLFLNDTSIVIKRIYDKSISTQFNEIIKQIASNYVFLTRGLTQKPYEIFVPIFEDTLDNYELGNSKFHSLEVTPKSYSEFWGIYLDKDDEASIYDVKRTKYINGNIEFLTD
jgi:hypothetical protein